MEIKKIEDGTGCKCIECEGVTKLTRLKFGMLAFYLCPGCRKALRFAIEGDSHGRQADLKAALVKIDNDDAIDVTEWEAGFLETCIRGFTAGRFLSERQIEVAEKMVAKYIKE